MTPIGRRQLIKAAASAAAFSYACSQASPADRAPSIVFISVNMRRG